MYHFSPLILANFTLMSLFRKDDKETPEDKLITMIKRAILSLQREEFERAEQVLHMALRMAQDLQSKDGITYVYDTMANVAMEKGDFEKAEKLFVSVMQRLFGDGLTEDDPKMLHISAKIAHMAEMAGHLDKARQGFEWTIKKLEQQLQQNGEDSDLLELWGLTKNWYGQTLMQLNVLPEAKKCFLEAYETYTKIHGRVTGDGVLMLNNLGVVCTNLGDLDSAEAYLKEAIELAKEIPDLVEVAIFQANLGLVLLKRGLLQQATDLCTLTWRIGTRAKNEAIVDQSNYCLEQIKQFQGSG